MSDLMMPRFLPARPAASRMEAGHLVASLRLVMRTWLTRQSLPTLTQRQLADIGLSPSMALTEAARLPWDVVLPSRRSSTGIVSGLKRILERARRNRLTVRRNATNLV